MKTLSALFAATIVSFVLSGCNTVSGLGKDVQKVGQAVTGASGK